MARMVELASEYGRYGYRRITAVQIEFWNQVPNLPRSPGKQRQNPALKMLF